MPERSKFTRYKPKITKSHGIGKTFFKNLTSGSKCCIIKKLYNKEYDGFVLCPFFFFCPRTRNSGATEAALKFNITILQSECSAVGSAPALGACDRLVSRPPKARKISVFLAFSRFSAAVCFGKKLLTTGLTTCGFDSKNSISGCRVTVTRLLWEQVQAGSTPVIPTKNQPKMRFFAPLSADFFKKH